MKRIVTLLVSLAMALGLSAGTALAGGHEWHEAPPHGHVMLIGAEADGGSVSFDRCVELANGEALSVPAHHHSVHLGPAGGSLFVQGPLFQAGNWIMPLAPFHDIPFEGCEDIPNPFPLPG